MANSLLYIFNPDHDLALANNDTNYMAPAPARQLAGDLAIFPVWFAPPSAKVLAASAYNRSFLNELKNVFPVLGDIVTEAELINLTGTELLPWGWDPALRKRLIQLGISAECMPCDEEMSRIRKLSDRKQAVKLLSLLRCNDNLCGESHYLTSITELKQFVEGNEKSVLKAPLSGSGKGLYWCKGIFTPHIEHWCINTLKQQGAVIAEPVYEKAEDFAMQFRKDDNSKFSFSGYSLFKTTANGAYEGNTLLSDEEIEKQLISYVPLSTLSRLKESISDYFTTYFNEKHVRFIGVDMMVCHFGTEPHYRIHPSVEINLRMNMGMASRAICDNILCRGVKGIFRIDYYASPQLLAEEHERLSKTFPLLVEGGRVRSGYLSLVPVTPHARYSARIFVDTSQENR